MQIGTLVPARTLRRRWHARRLRAEHGELAWKVAAARLKGATPFVSERLPEGRIRMHVASRGAVQLLELGPTVAPASEGYQLPIETADGIIARVENATRGFVPFVEYIREWGEPRASRR
ncbi:MAG TPA: hypothetical protein VLA90_05235 [Actinomycetota bacterium]|nr:hypothetical protein [Actinomycetota bacterium]